MVEEIRRRLEIWQLRRRLTRAHALTDRMLLRQRTEEMRAVVLEAQALGLA